VHGQDAIGELRVYRVDRRAGEAQARSFAWWDAQER